MSLPSTLIHLKKQLHPPTGKKDSTKVTPVPNKKRHLVSTFGIQSEQVGTSACQRDTKCHQLGHGDIVRARGRGTLRFALH